MSRAAEDPAGLERVQEDQERLMRLGVNADLVGIPRRRARALVDQWVALSERYPQAVRVWEGIGPDSEGMRIGLDQVVGYREGVMLWNPMHLRMADASFEQMLADGVASGLHPPGCETVAALATHEFGHAVEQVVKEYLGDAAWDALHQSVVDCRTCGHAAENPVESFAEAFTALHHGSELCAGALRAAAIVRRALRGVGM